MPRKKTKTTRVRRVLRLEPVPAPNVLPENWVLGSTCLGCRTHYTSWEPEFQSEGVKHGQYDTSKQLPNTSRDYPICPTCLPYYWAAEGAIFGVK